MRRLITLIDALYDNHVRLIISAQVPAERLFDASAGGGPDGGGAKGDLIGTAQYVPDSRDEVFAFDRTLSRLHEMQSHAYLVRAATKGSSGGHALAGDRVPSVLFRTDSVLTEAEALDLFYSYDVDASGARRAHARAPSAPTAARRRVPYLASPLCARQARSRSPRCGCCCRTSPRSGAATAT